MQLHKSIISLLILVPSVTSFNVERRNFISQVAGAGAAAIVGGVTPYVSLVPASNAAQGKADAMILELEDSYEKLRPIPDLLEAEKWDEVRSILKTPPVNYLWNMGDGKNTLGLLAKETDEFELIDVKDELSISLQMCDQLTYDNVFIYFQPGSGKINKKEPIQLANKAMAQLNDAISLAKAATP